jgi:hypothetical protein
MSLLDLYWASPSLIIAYEQQFGRAAAYDAPRHAFSKDYNVTGDAPSAFFVTCRIFSSEGHTLKLSSRASPSVSAKACDTHPS